MGTPTSKRKTVNVTGNEIAELQRNLNQAIADEKRIEAYIADLKRRIKRKMGDAEELKINGVLAFTYAKTGSYAWAKFAEEHGEIADKYRIVVQKEGLDTEAILRDHPNLVADYQSRQFLVK